MRHWKISAFLGLIVAVIFVGQCMAEEEQAVNSPEQSLFTPAVVEVNSGSPISTPIEFFIDHEQLNVYEAALGDLSLCKDDQNCVEDATAIKKWVCAAAACDGKDINKNVNDCFGGRINNVSEDKEVIGRLISSFCSMIKKPSAAARKEHLSQYPSPIEEDGLVEDQAYLLALNGTEESCVNYIKDYAGAYGPGWKPRFYRALSGCRILAKKTTREQEEKDFYTWLGAQRKFTCSGIMNPELNSACQTPTSTSPQPPKETMAVSTQKEPFPIKFLVEQMRLKMFEASGGDLSLCQNDEECLAGAQKIKVWRCLSDVCSGKDTAREPFSCLENASSQFSVIDQNTINTSMCAHIKSPDSVSRKELIKHTPNMTEEDYVSLEAYYLAFNESAGSCQNYIKFYVGDYGPQWNYKWYRALSGCRLLSGESTRQYEESDFYTWFGVERNFNCSQIDDSEMRMACNAPGATLFSPAQSK